MNVQELQERLDQMRVRKDCYRINEIHPFSGNTIRQTKKGAWWVYYCEYNSIFDLKIFDNESEACNYFYNWIVEDIKKNPDMLEDYIDEWCKKYGIVRGSQINNNEDK